MKEQNIHTEGRFEAVIEEALLQQGGYKKGQSSDFDAALGFFPSYVVQFLQQSQPKKWAKIQGIHKDQVGQKVVQRLQKEISLRGLLHVLRNGFTDYGVKFKMLFLKPVTQLNPSSWQAYASNQLQVTRQLYFQRKGKKSLDMVLSINGLVIATIEIKNQFTGQNTADAQEQYKKDRAMDEPILRFNQGALVHFALDHESCYMTTKLEGSKTFYLPFNKGMDHGAGNPEDDSGYKTAYLWQKIWEKDSFLDIVGKYLHLEVENYKKDGKVYTKKKMIFPRYHQLDVVRRLTKDAQEKGAGQNYLIQHSAGSGKSNSIAWLSYRLSSLHNLENKRVFDVVIVITDRRVLDSQLQDTIFQFDHKEGVVQKIDKDSQQLADALAAGSNIIITTLQKFPFVLDKIGDLPSRNYAVVIDEAHSSQGGEASKKMKEVLAAKSLEEAEEEELDSGLDETAEDKIRQSMLARGQQNNLSFFAFTATPKPKTIEVFGTLDKEGKPKPFHLYSMRQAIEEGFILDVLKNYTTYKTYFQLSKQIEEDPNVNKKEASRAIGRFVSLHPHNLAQKAEVIVEHFRKVVCHKIGGKAKAMVVTSSRLHVVRYKAAFDDYIQSKGYTDIRTLVAFSGKVMDSNQYPEGVTEGQINGFKPKELPQKFETEEYQILLVADKYQTGFDQPLLHTMYVDKKLSGVKAVQTLSRLNRTCPGKEETFVLDFANEGDEILNAFQPYYELTTVKENTNPNRLYDLKGEIEQAQIIWQSEVDSFCNVYFQAAVLPKAAQGKLYKLVEPAKQRYISNLPEKTGDVIGTISQDDFKHLLKSFIRLYGFLTQIMPFSDVELEKLFTYCRFLLKVLPRKTQSERFQLGDEVALEYYRLQKVAQQNIVLEPQGEYGLDGTNASGIRGVEEESAALSEIIKLLNTRFAVDFTEADKLFFDQLEADLVADEKLMEQGKHNTKDNFSYVLSDAVMRTLINRMEQNQDIFKKIMDDDEFKNVVWRYLLDRVYDRAQK